MGFAEGLNSGLSAVSNIAGLMQKKKEMDRANALEKQLDEANKAGSEAYQSAIKGATQSTRMTAGDMDAQPGFGQASQLGLNGAVSLGAAPSLGDQVAAPQQMGGMDPNAAQGLGQSLTLGGAQAPAQQTVTKQATDNDDREAILAGMKARRGHLMKAGVDPKAWMPDWAQEAKLRGEIRSERLDDAEKRFAVTGDPMEWAKVVYPLVDDGKTLVAADPIKGMDGSMGWNFKVRNDDTGEEATNTVSAQQFDRMRMMARDPSAVIKDVEAPALLARLKASAAIQAEEGKQGAVRETNRQKHGLKLEEIKVDGEDQRRTVAARTAGDIASTRVTEGERRATERTKPIVLGADATLVERDGQGEYKPVAKGKDKATGADTPTSAPNKILQLRAQAEAAARANPAKAKEIKARFKALTGKDF
jgi:hypothetical protein